jgi:hypothetical protein
MAVRGFLSRKGDGAPGAKIMWQSLKRVMGFAADIKYAQSRS